MKANTTSWTVPAFTGGRGGTALKNLKRLVEGLGLEGLGL